MNSQLNRPASVKPGQQPRLPHGRKGGQLSYADTFAPINHPPVSPTISGLLSLGGPDTVFRGVAKSIIHPLNRGLRKRLEPHVRKEYLKRLPSRAHLDPPSSITLPLPVGRARASVSHAVPRHILRCLPLGSVQRGCGVPVNKTPGNIHLSLMAPARLHGPSKDAPHPCSVGSPAGALAGCEGIPAFAVVLKKHPFDGEPTKSFSNMGLIPDRSCKFFAHAPTLAPTTDVARK